jgi:hypothetical protein
MRVLRYAIVLAGLVIGVFPASTQTVRVDISQGKAIPFDPDQSLGSSLDILPARQFENI